jgi:phosphate-selective porin OprO/OprP
VLLGMTCRATAQPALPPLPDPSPLTPAARVAPDPATVAPPVTGSDADLKARIERLEKQNQELLDALRGLQSPTQTAPPAPGTTTAPLGTSDVQKIVGDYLKTREEAKKEDDTAKAKEAEAKGFTVGKNLGFTGKWTGHQLWFETPDKAFRLHFGGRTQFDAVWATASPHVQTGVGGTGKFDDAFNFRRARFDMDGWLWEVFDFYCQYDFVQTINVDPTLPPNPNSNVTNVPTPTDLWGGINYIPWIGTVRLGNMKPPIGLDHLISSRFLDFMERASYFDAWFNRTNGFQPGIQMLNWSDDERLTWQVGFFKNNQTIMGWNPGDGEYQFNARGTWLPYYRDDGRYMVHLGLGVQYDQPDANTAILRERWLLRNGPPTTHNTVALASIIGHHQSIVVPEFFANFGPLSVQAEYLGSWMDDIAGFTTQSQGFVANGNQRRFFGQSAYVQALYFLTGEHRPYGKTGLHGSGAAPTRVVPYRNYFLVNGQDGTCCSGGAWQVGVRYCYTDLSNNGIYGGQTNEVTLGLNWFLNPNVKFQWNYDMGWRGQLGPTATANGMYQGFGTRLAFDW